MVGRLLTAAAAWLTPLASAMIVSPQFHVLPPLWPQSGQRLLFDRHTVRGPEPVISRWKQFYGVDLANRPGKHRSAMASSCEDFDAAGARKTPKSEGKDLK